MSAFKKVLLPVVAVAVLGGGAAYWFLKGGPTADSSSPAASAEVVPDNALMATFISNDAKGWSQLQQFGTPEAQKLISQGVQSLQASMLKGSQLNYDKDLKPWVGSVMVAVMPSTSSNAQQSDTLLVVGIKDKVRALAFANQAKSQPGVQTQESDYKGVKISAITQKDQPKSTIYSAVLSDRLVLADKKATIEQAVDTFKGAPSFADKSGAAQLMATGVDVENPIAQIYLPNYGTSVKQLIANSPQAAQLPPQSMQQLDQVESLVVGVGVDESGLRVKAKAKAKPQATAIQYKPVPGKVVAAFPTETLALVTGQGLKTAWITMVEQAQEVPQSQIVVDTVRQQLKTVNLDADKEVFGWMDGEFGLGAIALNQGVLSSVGFGGVIVLETSDRATAEATLTKLDAIAQKNYMRVAQRNVQGKTITEWKLPQQESILGHGWLNQNSLFIAVGSPLIDGMIGPAKQPLDQSTAFKTVTGSLAKPNAGYFYLDMDKVMAVMNTSLLKTQTNGITPETTAMLNSIRGLGITVTQPDKTTAQVEMLLALKPKAVSLK
jgi:hypothetical protein